MEYRETEGRSWGAAEFWDQAFQGQQQVKSVEGDDRRKAREEFRRAIRPQIVQHHLRLREIQSHPDPER